MAWPSRGAEVGIDLVAEDHEAHLWAIQAKAYDPAAWITKRDVDTFLSESARSQFSFRLLIATTDRIGRTAKRTIEAQEKQASVLLLSDLEAAELDWPGSPSDLRARRGIAGTVDGGAVLTPGFETGTDGPAPGALDSALLGGPPGRQSVDRAVHGRGDTATSPINWASSWRTAWNRLNGRPTGAAWRCNRR